MYNVTKFLEDHPGGKDIILEEAGKDVTDVFEEAAHSSEARDILPSLLVGRLQVYHDTVQTFDLVVGRAVQPEGGKNSWNGPIMGPAAVTLAALAVWGYGRSLPSKLDPMWMATMVVLLTALGVACTFVSYVIYVDFGRLQKYPSRIRL